jgi:hypothetical protein
VDWTKQTRDDVRQLAKKRLERGGGLTVSPRWLLAQFDLIDKPEPEDRPLLNMRNEPDWAAIAKASETMANAIINTRISVYGSVAHRRAVEDAQSAWSVLSALLAELPQTNEVGK